MSAAFGEYYPLFILVVGVAIVFFLILRLKLNAFIALIVAAISVGLLSDRMSSAEVMGSVAGKFGEMCAGIGIVIALAALIGQCLMESGAADKVVRVLVRGIGEKRASLPLLSSGYILSVPVFFDTVFYLLVPLARALRIRTGGNYALFIMAVAAGGAVTHSMVPPTPGPLAMADALSIDLGTMILMGAAIGIPMSLAGWAYARWTNSWISIPLRETAGIALADLEELARKDDKGLPSFALSMAPIVLPVLMIASNTVVNSVNPESPAKAVTAFIGNPNFALLVSAFVSLYLLAKQKGYSLSELASPVETAFASGGIIILITAAGGSFGKMLLEAGVDDTLSMLADQFGMPILLLSFVVAVLFKIAQGSGTVSMVVTSSIIAGIIAGDTNLPIHPVYLACAIGAGSLVGSWMNDSGYWVYKQMSGLTEEEALKTWTPLLAVLGISGFLSTWLLSTFFPMV